MPEIERILFAMNSGVRKNFGLPLRAEHDPFAEATSGVALHSLHAVQIISSLDIGSAGPTTSVRRLAEALGDRGVRSEILSLGVPGDQMSGGARSRVVSTDRPRLPGWGGLLPSRDLSMVIDECARTGAVLHAHGLWRMPNIYPAQAARRHGAPLVISPRGMLSKAALGFSPKAKAVFWMLAQKRALRAASCLHATGEAEAVDIRAAGMTQAIAVVPNGIDVPAAAEVFAGKARRSPSGPRTVLQLGRLHPIKRIDRLLEAWANIEVERPEWRLRIVGPSEGAHGDELKAQAARLGLARVSFEPALYGAAKDAAFREADVVVLASESENFGMVVAEALANGTPVIASKGAPWPGVVAERCGWWVDHGVAPLTAALVDATASPRPALDAMGDRGRAWMLRDFSWAKVAADMETVYRWSRGVGAPPACMKFD